MTKLLSVTREKLSSWNYYRFHQKPYNAQRRAATKEREAINNTKASYGYKKRNNNIYLNSITILLHHLLKRGMMLALARDISLCSLFLAYFDQGKKK